MKKIIYTFALLLCSVLGFTQNIVTITDADLGNGTYNWTNDNTYLLDGFVYVEEGGVLNIEAGTVIKGKASPTDGNLASALIITRGAKINANGNAAQPIIFTAETDDISNISDLGLNNRGLWGGLIMLGNAPVAEDGGSDFIEGLPSTETRAYYGGDNPADNSGTLTYVSIRHGGAELEPDVEINGLTLGGVGSGTTIDYLEVVSNLDDGIELFGGKVNIKHAAVAYCGDECFDYDEGWSGNGQFWFGMVGFDKGDQPGEHDGSEATPGSTYDFPSFPHIYNATYIGPGDTAVSVKCPAVMTIKARGAGIYANSIFTDFAKAGLQIEDKPAADGDDSYGYFLRDSIQILNSIWYAAGWNSVDDIVKVAADAEHAGASELKASFSGAWANEIGNPGLNNIDHGSYQFLTEILGNGNLDPRPQSNSIAYQNLASYDGLDGFFTEVSYKGAFGEENWMLGWTALDAYGFLDQTSGIENVALAVNTLQVFPNPTTASQINVTIDSPETFNATIAIYNELGQKLNMEVPVKINTGNNTISLPLSTLPQGIYQLIITNEKGATAATSFILE
ncbi:MAG: T9SS type A sorting domain-containing protein [Chitinophagales bacterium]